ncbi:VOC family protein [Streptomyces sp. NPDC004959]|uniref:VOC family protein n=1 Tax=Streptomyces sp. NPDC004959 TaxID=3154673 RepID=UPI0033A737FE
MTSSPESAPARFKDLCLDARDHQALADWWCAAMGYVRRGEGEPVGRPVAIVDPVGGGPLIWVVPVPEGKVVKNRMHHDVYGDVERLRGLGARVVQEPDAAKGIPWHVMRDPEGNEFCVFAPAG